MTVKRYAKRKQELISIHTSAKEVTVKVSPELYAQLFQSTLPRRKWLCHSQGAYAGKNFNPHFREGSDTGMEVPGGLISDFNPHFREGSDRWEWHRCRFPWISIHTSAKEVTIDKESASQILEISIHTSAKEVTTGHCIIRYIVSISIHTSAKEVTLDHSLYVIKEEFQSTLPRRKWRKGDNKW